ncbi:hypothetical protein O6H91_12G072800 [Diphasiastrum complanatum]|uniref:Uncharacterized protein n=1 Tax=Diphasiastrum complanatum TaxID=34168 RepID=A0ACC2C3C0_DIPCM|nr:hypothetical protein O6H91_12G072800 [Diphasiastrum complanatum]
MLYERNVAEEQGQLKGERYESMTMLWSLCSFNKEQIHGSKLVVGQGMLVWDGQKIIQHYIYSRWILFDAFVILPIPQIVFWMIIPCMLRAQENPTSTSILLGVFLFQYIPKLVYLVMLIKRLQQVTGYIFDKVAWGFILNLLAYLTAAHVAGSIWYLLGVQRVELCLERACKYIQDCDSSLLVCTPVIHYGKAPKYPTGNSPLSQDPTASSLCKSSNNFDFNYGIYLWAAPLVTTTNGLQRMIFPLFWGLMTLSSFGNALTPSNHMLEAAFSIIVIICGLLLFTMLIGNIQVFLQSITAKQQLMRFRFRDFEWWMKRRQLPIRLRRRVRDYERLRWAATRGIEEDAMVRDLPQGLRREVKGHLCLDLLRQVPLFGQMDQNMLDSICDQLKQFLFAKDEVIIREGEPVLRMLFILRGEVLAVYNAASIKQAAHQVRLKPGDFWGEELLSWCLHRPVINQLPLSSATLKCSDTAEAFGLEANDIMYVTQHLRSKFLSDMLAHSIRYYSINWRTWAVVTIQLAWRRCKVRRAGAEKVLAVASSQNVTAEYERSGAVVMVPKDVVKRSRILGASQKECLRLCTAIMNSPKPNSNCY